MKSTFNKTDGLNLRVGMTSPAGSILNHPTKRTDRSQMRVRSVLGQRSLLDDPNAFVQSERADVTPKQAISGNVFSTRNHSLGGTGTFFSVRNKSVDKGDTIGIKLKLPVKHAMHGG